MLRVKVTGAAILAVLLAVAVSPVTILKAEGPALSANSAGFSLKTVELAGVSSDVNNIAFAFDGKYSVVAPFETSDPDNQDPFQGDNHYLVVTELANPSNQFKLDLTTLGASPQTCYYPTHLIVSSNNIAFVRASAADSVTHQPIGEVIAYGTLMTDKVTGAVRFDGSILPVQILRFLPSSDPGSMPVGFGVSAAGEFLVFTNGAQIFTVDLPTGNLYKVQPVPDGQYAPLPDPSDPKAGTSDYQTITGFDVSANNIVKVVVNGRTGGNDFSKVYFYRLREGMKRPGTLDLLAVPVDSSQLAGGQIAPDSMVAVSDDGTLGYFATTDGWLWSVELKNSPSLVLTPLKNYASISGQTGYLAGPRDVLIDPTGKSLSIVKQGGTLNIRRPTYGKHGGGIRRPTYIRYSETPGFVLASLNANGSIASDLEAHDQGFGNGTYAISNPVFTAGGAYLTVSFGDSQGALKLLKSAGGFTDFGALPSNIGQIASADGSNIVGIQDFDVSSQSSVADLVIKGGSLVFMSMQKPGDALVTASIRRPCNDKH